MVAIPEAISVLYPNATIGPNTIYDVVVSSQGINYWNPALGPQPSQAALDAVTQAQVDAARTAIFRAATKAILAAAKAEGAILRAFLLIVLDEFNTHSAKTNAILTAIDGSSSLANLKTAVAAINDLPTRTAVQLKTAIQSKIDAGDADT